jgi:hypothetical protein
MTKDLSLTVPFSPAIVLGPSIINGDLIAILSVPNLLRRGKELAFESGISNNGGSGNNTSSELVGRPSGNGGEGPYWID